MFKKGSVFYSLFNNKCPRCQEGDFFVDGNPFHLKNSLKIHKHCSHCNLKYMKETAFFYGAMYVNYGVTVAEAIATFIIAYSFGLTIPHCFIAIVITILVFTPLNLKLARLIWINFFESYDKKYDK